MNLTFHPSLSRLTYELKSSQKLYNNNINNDDIRTFWSEVLKKIQENENRINMIHLDSLIWQMASLSENELCEYFRSLGVEHIGCKLIKLFESSFD